MRMLATIAYTFANGPTRTNHRIKQQSPELEVLDYKWAVPHSTTFHQNPGFSADASNPREDRNRREPLNDIERTQDQNRKAGDSSITAPPPRGDRKVEQTVTRLDTYAHIKNTGNKRIKAISWSYVFYADVYYQREVKRHSFRSKVDISPGQESNLIKQVSGPGPTRYQKVLINQIEYSDGSKWQGLESKQLDSQGASAACSSSV